MFDIGILEILVIAVVALLIVGPEEFPFLLRSVGRTFGKIRRMITSVRDQFEGEIEKAEKIKQKMQEEAKLANLHQEIQEGVDKVNSTLRQPVPVSKLKASSDPNSATPPPKTTDSTTSDQQSP